MAEHVHADDPTAAEEGDRLPRGIAPRRYDLVVTPDLDASAFEGEVTIEAEVLEATETIVMHSVDLDLSSVWVRSGDGTTIDAGVGHDSEHETITLDLGRTLEPGEIEIHLAFRGELNDHLVGFYRSTFRRDDTEMELAVTQFESTHARRAFPCFDEPAFKAVFGITLVVADDLLAVSNAAEIDRVPDGEGRVRVRFADTMVMSTYLVAFVVGPLETTETVVVDGRDRPIPLRVVHMPGQGELCEFALEVAAAGLRFFEDYYDLPYPGDKVDLVAVPDFAFGAMENLGCIVFREVLLVIDPLEATPQELQRVADVINHELAHMWFGDLVTMKWWNGIWLNEAFATFMELKASDAFRAEWDVWSTFGIARAAAFDTDSLRSTRPIEYPVRTAADAEAMFDVLTYEKGCSVVRMLEQYLGEEAFREGIRRYLHLHAWSNTETTDLWDVLENSSGEPVRRIMDSWIFTGGHPLVEITLDGGELLLSQRRAALSAEVSDEGSRWPVPIVAAVGTDDVSDTTRVLLEEPLRLDAPQGLRWVQANVAGNGFYRCLPSDGLRRGLAEAGGTPLERFGLLDDTWFAVRAGLLGVDAARDTVATVASRERDPTVWRCIAAICDELANLLGPANLTETAGWVRELVTDARARFDEPDAATGRCAEVVGVLMSLGGTVGDDPAVLATARGLFGRPDTIDPAIAAAALKVVATHASAEEYDEVLRRWREASTPQEEQRHLGALATVREPELFAHTLALAFGEVRTQDAPYLLRQALHNPGQGPSAWGLLTTRWADAIERFPSSGLPRMLEGIRSFTDEDLAAEVSAFLAGHPLEVGGAQVDQHVERMMAGVLAARRLRG
jgi:puromycin-sensitive aminopeptidase